MEDAILRSGAVLPTAMGYTVTMDVDTRQLGSLTIADDVIEVFDGRCATT